jgi:hypothetical protein
MDYLVIGSNGFAKAGDPDVDKKEQIELKFLFYYFNAFLPVPEEFKDICRYEIKWFRGCRSDKYSELVLVYNDMLVEDWACDSNYHEQFDRFWAWCNKIESINLQSDEITKGIEKVYLESVKNSG